MKILFYFLILAFSIGSSYAQSPYGSDKDSLTQRFKHAPFHIHDTIGTKTFHADSLLHYADKFLGIPYVKAGQSPKGFDCSGFTMYCFRHFGVQLPHSAHDQALLGTEVHLAEVEPGDLLFFKGHNLNDHTIHHVAMVVHKEESRIRFIHSAHHTVHYSYLDNSYYAPRLVKVKRIQIAQ